MTTPTYDVAVVGAGIVGAACAFTLRRDGARVVLIDRGEPRRAASWGNAGHFAYEQVLPLATPDLWRSLPRLLFARESPLRIPPRNLWPLAPWLARFAWNTRAPQVRRATAALAALLCVAPEAWRRLASAAGLEALIRGGPMLVVARDAAALAAKRPVIEAFRRHGTQVEEIGALEARAIEPMLRHDIAGAFVYPRAQHTVDPAKLTANLTAAYRATGGIVANDSVSSVRIASDGTASVVGSASSWVARRCVVAAGLGSRDILHGLGIEVPLAAERGYHLMIPYVEGRPTMHIPLIGARPEFVITPMAEGVRLAGTVELARSESHPDWSRATMLRKLAEQIVQPLGAGSDGAVWMGCRPSLPDSLPIIGPIPAAPAIVGAFGHQHLGLTLAAITAEAVCAIVRHRPPPIDIAAYSAARF
ncbi:MAG TPA: FAD-binding oxidoreductase [Casimicrobiaceae bacterium]